MLKKSFDWGSSGPLEDIKTHFDGKYFGLELPPWTLKLKDPGRYPAPRDLPDNRLRKKRTDSGEFHRTSDVKKKTYQIISDNLISWKFYTRQMKRHYIRWDQIY